MRFMLWITSALLTISWTNIALADDLTSVSFDFRLSNTSLPKAVSDLTATLYDDLVYLAGGCDAENGNVFNDEIGEFICSSASSSLYSFDYKSDSIQELASMPTARYRHAAVAINGKIWLVGGRSAIDDTIISAVDVYDIESDSWKSFELPTQYYSSDLTGFSDGNNLAFFCGGYDASYSNYLYTVFAIDTAATLANSSSSSSSLVIVDKEPLIFGRGDVSSAVDETGTYALVSGGFGSKNAYCSPVEEVELYDIVNNIWTSVAPIPVASADMALVELNGQFFAFGGERQIEGICDNGTDTPEPGEKTVAVDEVLVLDTTNRNWTFMEDLPEHRFRFAAAAIDAINTVYTFGGQLDYDGECRCYKTSSDIMVYEEVENVTTDDSTTPSSAAVMIILNYSMWWTFIVLPITTIFLRPGKVKPNVC